jgi:hypothetical protein
MTRLPAPLCICAAVLGLAVCGAAEAAAPGEPLWGSIGLAAYAETPADLSHFADAGISMDAALAAVKQQHAGRLVEIGFSSGTDAPSFAGLLETASGLQPILIDPATGAIRDADRPRIARADLDAVGQRDLAALDTAHVSLEEAISRIEQISRNRVISAGVEQLAGIPQYYLQTASSGRLDAWIVDPATGRVMHPEP